LVFPAGEIKAEASCFHNELSINKNELPAGMRNENGIWQGCQKQGFTVATRLTGD
jgi:hypothetical protein